MIYMTAFYPYEEGKKFNMEYYKNKHVHHIMNVPGSLAKNVSIYEGTQGYESGTPPFFFCLAITAFDNIEDMHKTFELTGDMFADVVNYTDVEPMISVSEKAL